MKLCPTCKNKYADDANFCPREECATPQGPSRLLPIAEEPLVRFVPVSRIGGSVSGEVWQASDAQSGAAVAYKVIAPEVLPTPVALERTQRELRQLQRAGNPHIVKVIEFGKTSEGQLFVASELATGEPLDQVVGRSGPFALDRAKKIAAQIGEALLEAQKVGVVHRDLAAKNILVSGDDHVRVINFAIPRPLTETLFGVPEYMSPEQSEGKLIDQRSNTYSLGALLYLMLTGQPPHVGATAQATIEAIQKGEITPPSIKRGSGLTAEVDRIVLKALERNSSRRPLTMRQFLTDVSGLIVTEQAAASSGAAARDAGFAKTMMFAGGASEVQKLVAQAVAARQAAGNGTTEAVSEAAAVPAASAKGPTPPPLGAPTGAGLPQGTPAPAAPMAVPSSGPSAGSGGRPSHGAAVAATMIALPGSAHAAAGIPGSSQAGGTPSPVAPVHTPPLAGAGADPNAGNFRETLWFKKGDVDQMVADARAKVAAMASAKKAAAEPELPAEDAKPLEDRYQDDGTVTVEDRKKFSLASGATSAAMPTRGSGKVVPGERMTEDEVLGEIGGGKRVMIIGIVAAVVVALIAVVIVSVKGKPKEKPPVEKAQIAEPAAVAPETTPAAAAPATPAAPKTAEPKTVPPAAPAEKAEAAVAPAKPDPAPKAPSKKKAVSKKKSGAGKKRK
jgi:hypothetical protein